MRLRSRQAWCGMYCPVLYKGVCTARPGELLPSLVDPEVGDPLGAGQDGAGRVPGQVVTLQTIFIVEIQTKVHHGEGPY